MKKIKSILINVVLILVLGALAAGFLYGWSYYKKKYNEKKEENKEAVRQEKTSLLASLLIAEVENKEKKQWGKLFFLDANGQEISTIKTAHKASYFSEPKATKGNIYYYESAERKDSSENMILWSAGIGNNSENKIAAFTTNYYPLGIWISPDEKYIVYMRAFKDSGEYSYWIYHTESGIARELVPPSPGYYPAPYQGFSADSGKFYFFEKNAENEYKLYQVRIEGSIVTPAFQTIDWDEIDWNDLWEVKPFDISPDGLSFVYLDRKQDKEETISTDIVLIDKAGKSFNLKTLNGNIYELAWSGAGKKLAFNYAPFENGERQKAELWVMDKDGSNPKKIFESESQKGIISDIYWDYDDNVIYFIDRVPEEYSQVNKINLKDNEIEVLYEYTSDQKNDNYLKILQYLDVPKSLDWLIPESDTDKSE